MTIAHYLANFFAGLLLCNCLPHLVSGLRGESFPTPFAKPPGRGNSSAVTNFLWGSLNFFAGIFLIARFPVFVGLNLNSALFIAGFLLSGVCLACHFGKVRKNQGK